MTPSALHLDLDGAWNGDRLTVPTIDARNWGPQLRFSAPPRVVEAFYLEFRPRLRRFLIYGSGDFHHLTALWVRRVDEPVVLVSFDNHPDWDLRPPKWCCGGWVNRALEVAHVQRVSVWGCGNFECWWPQQLFGNRRAERAGRLEVHPWVDDRSEKDRGRRGAISRENWRELFQRFVKNLGAAKLYVTIDLDCLRCDEALTNWENGRFTADDIIWALAELRQQSQIVAADICGAFSEPVYARWKQKFASEMDHPKLARPSREQINQVNFSTFEKLWPALVQ